MLAKLTINILAFAWLLTLLLLTFYYTSYIDILIFHALLMMFTCVQKFIVQSEQFLLSSRPRKNVHFNGPSRELK